MDKITVRRNETFQRAVTIDDMSAQTIRFDAFSDTSVVITASANFTDGTATIDAGLITAAIGVYNYSLTVTYSDGRVDILPDVANCNGDCSFPVFEICAGGIS